MSANPYAPPIASPEPLPVKRPFFKSGARILLVAFIIAFFVPLLGALCVSGLYGLGIIPLGANIVNIYWAEKCVSRTVVAAALSFVPIGVWRVGDNCRATKPISRFWMVTIGIAALSAILVWVENIYSYIESEPEYSDLYFYSSQIPGISRDLAIITLALLIQRLATLRQARWTRNLAVISTSLVIIAWLHALTMVDEPGEERWFYMSAGTLIAVGIGFASKFFLLATIWSARILEDVPPEDAEMDGL